MASSGNSILYCHCAYAQILPKEVKEAVLKRLCESESGFTAVPDLCEMSARKDPFLRRLSEEDSCKIAACFPRAVKWLFKAAGAPLLAEKCQVLNLRVQAIEEVETALLRAEITPNLPVENAKAGVAGAEIATPPNAKSEDDATEGRKPALRILLPANETEPAGKRFETVLALLEKGYAVSCGAAEDGIGAAGQESVIVLGRFAGEARRAAVGEWQKHYIDVQQLKAAQVVEKVDEVRAQIAGSKPGQWFPWFPVIDFDRCTDCMQCLSFCLFGVFGVDDGQRVEVALTENCKTNCPACSRVCPEAAIIFPKYKTGPINGEEVMETDVQREKMKIDVSALLGGDIYEMLRERSQRAQSRFSKERDPEKALRERQRCLAKLAQFGEIPPEVLMALPAPEEIKRKVQEAMAKAQAAREQIGKPPAGAA